jgi:hypothetical protein
MNVSRGKPSGLVEVTKSSVFQTPEDGSNKIAVRERFASRTADDVWRKEVPPHIGPLYSVLHIGHHLPEAGGEARASEPRSKV